MQIPEVVQRIVAGQKLLEMETALESERSEYKAEIEGLNATLKALQESFGELELHLRQQGWQQLGPQNGSRDEFSRESIETLIELARLNFIKNPLIKRAVTVKTLYVWCLGVNIKANSDDVQSVLNEFFNDPKNKRQIGTHSAWTDREIELQTTGNLFFVFFVNPITGFVRVRTIPVTEVADIVTNPEDRFETWYYCRKFINRSNTLVEEYFPDIDWNPANKPDTWEGKPIRWDNPVLMVKDGHLPGMRFGLPSYYCALDWAKAYKDFLEDWSTIMRAYSRIAMKMTGLQGAKGTAAAKAQFGTSITSQEVIERNPSPTTASMAFFAGGVDLQAVKTAGATTPASEGRPLKLMVASGVGLPDTFFGDADVGNFATSQTLDRPTELGMVDRQKRWSETIIRICEFVMMWSAKAPGGELRSKGWSYEEMEDVVTGELIPLLTAASDSSKLISADFPSILERNVTDRVRAIVQAVTLMGKPLTDIIPDRRLIASWIIQALGVDDVPKVLDTLYPEGADVSIEPPAQPGNQPVGTPNPQEGG